MSQGYWKSGGYNSHCDICGWKFKNSELRKTWDGYYVCEKDWYPRNPLDFPVKVTDDKAPPWTRPEGTDENTSGTPLSLTGFVQFYSGQANSPEIPEILFYSIVTLTLFYQDGPTGTHQITINPGVGFTVSSSNNLELSSYSYTVIVNPVEILFGNNLGQQLLFGNNLGQQILFGP